jgi:hypothetical protein
MKKNKKNEFIKYEFKKLGLKHWLVVLLVCPSFFFFFSYLPVFFFLQSLVIPFLVLYVYMLFNEPILIPRYILIHMFIFIDHLEGCKRCN